jgi:hypothetical protein
MVVSTFYLSFCAHYFYVANQAMHGDFPVQQFLRFSIPAAFVYEKKHCTFIRSMNVLHIGAVQLIKKLE